MHKPTNKLPAASLDPQRLMMFPREINRLFSNMNPEFVNGRGLAVQFFSAQPNEGTSTIARDFALTSAQFVDGPVLLLDFDWGQDSHFKHFQRALQQEGVDSKLESPLDLDLDLSPLIGRTEPTNGMTALEFHPIEPWPRNRPTRRASSIELTPPDRESASSTDPVSDVAKDGTTEPRHQPQTEPAAHTGLPERGLILGRTAHSLQDIPGSAPCILNRPDIWSLLRGYFRMIVVDSPPSNQSPDAFVISGSMDAVIIVVRAESTRAPVVADMRDRLVSQGAPLAGVILNHRRLYIPQRVYRWLG